MLQTFKTCPNITLSIFSGFRPAAWIAAVDAAIAKSVALLFANMPPIVPNGVCFAATMKIPVGDLNEFDCKLQYEEKVKRMEDSRK